MFPRLSPIRILALFAGLLAVSGGSAYADLVDFENQAAGPCCFGNAAQTLVYTFPDVTATFTGGTILTAESAQSTDNSNVYATSAASLTGPGLGLTNPLVIKFSSDIQNFQIQILNAISGNYTMADNMGNSVNFNLATTGGSIATEGFAAAGNQVTITYDDAASAGEWDFAIDNVTFDEPLTGSTPEPATMATLGAGLMLLGFGAWRKTRSVN